MADEDTGGFKRVGKVDIPPDTGGFERTKPAAPEKVFYNDAGQPFSASGAPVPQPPESYTGAILPFRRDENGLHLAVPEIIATPLRGAVEGGERALGYGQAGIDPEHPDKPQPGANPLRPLSPDTLGAVLSGAGTRLTGMADRGMIGPSTLTPGGKMSPVQPPAPPSPKVEARILDRFERAIKPTVAGKDTGADIARAKTQRADAISSIVQNKPNLKYLDPKTGETITGQLPQNIEQFADAIGQTRERIFEQYDAMAKAADVAETGANTSVPKFREAYDAASARTAQAERDLAAADRKMTLATAQQHRAGDNVYLSSVANRSRATAASELRAAEAGLQRAQAAKATARSNMGGAWVDLTPIAGELEKIAGDKAVRDFHPNIQRHAEELAARLQDRQAYSPLEAQRVIQNLNASLKAFNRNPTYENAVLASVDNMVVNNLRRELDGVIEETVAPGYQGLKNQYGALKSIEKDVVNRSIVEGRKNVGGGLLGNFGDLFSAEEVLRGVLTMRPGAVATGVGIKGMIELAKRYRDPNRAVMKMFEDAERQATPRVLPSPAGTLAPALGNAARLGPLGAAPQFNNDVRGNPWDASLAAAMAPTQ